MAPTPRTLKLLWGRAGGRCSFPDCKRELMVSGSSADDEVITGEVAHIVAQGKLEGPRRDFDPPGGDLHGYQNLILLCEEHHKLVDGQPNTYTVQKLVQMREDHERWVHDRLSPEQRFQQALEPEQHITETIHSTLLPVVKIPQFVYLAPCDLSEKEVKEKVVVPQGSEIMLPFIIRGGNILTFCDLRELNGPFYQLIDTGAVERYNAQEWWDNPDYYRWYIELLNRTLNKLTGRRGLNLDKEHRRYYFELEEGTQERSIKYLSLNGRKTSRKVVFRPSFRHSGQAKNYWEHLAVSLQFHRVTEETWCFSIRPERRFTLDGYKPLSPKSTGRRATSKKSKMRNINVLTEVHFWRDFLSDGKPRIICNFGVQSLIIETELLHASVSWPGVPDDTGHFDYTRYSDDLFTLAELQTVLDMEDDNSLEDYSEE
jgi:hypothetical protein